MIYFFVKSLPWPLDTYVLILSFYRNVFLSQYRVHSVYRPLLNAILGQVYKVQYLHQVQLHRVTKHLKNYAIIAQNPEQTHPTDLQS